VILRDASSGLYYRGLDDRTETPDEASNWHTSGRAARLVAMFGLRNVEMVFMFDDARDSITVPLSNRASSSTVTRTISR
jgi:hypothetical protein